MRDDLYEGWVYTGMGCSRSGGRRANGDLCPFGGSGCADGRSSLGYAVPIGGVVAYEEEISPSGVGFDIACGNKAVLLDADAREVQKNISRIMDDIQRQISFGMGRSNRERVEADLLDDDPAWNIEVAAQLKDLARRQLGMWDRAITTSIYLSMNGSAYGVEYFGSRGLGHKLASHFIRAGGGHVYDGRTCVLSSGLRFG